MALMRRRCWSNSMPLCETIVDAKPQGRSLVRIERCRLCHSDLLSRTVTPSRRRQAPDTTRMAAVTPAMIAGVVDESAPIRRAT